VPKRIPLLLDRIEALLDVRPPLREPQAFARIERTLTDGYASALALEGERLRIDREIETLTADIDGGDQSRRAEELSLLTRRRRKVDRELVYLRERLDLLRRRARELRSTFPQTQPT
jgi:hypothetical protein